MMRVADPIERAVELGLNVLFVGDPPDLSHQSISGLVDTSPEVVTVYAAGAIDTGELLARIGDALGIPEVRASGFDVYDQLAWLAKYPHQALVVLKNPEPESALRLFGRLRDELWQLPMTWLVAVRSEAEARALYRAPVDTFFPVVLSR